MTEAEDLLLEIANSMSKDFSDPIAHVDWILDAAKDYFVRKGTAADRDLEILRNHGRGR